MIFCVVNFLTGLLNLFVLLSFASVAASVSYIPLFAIAGSLILFFISNPIYVFRPKLGSLITFVGDLLVLPWLVGYFFELIKEHFQSSASDDFWIAITIVSVLFSLFLVSFYLSVRILFKQKGLGWGSDNLQMSFFQKVLLSLLPFSLLLLRLLIH